MIHGLITYVSHWLLTNFHPASWQCKAKSLYIPKLRGELFFTKHNFKLGLVLVWQPSRLFYEFFVSYVKITHLIPIIRKLCKNYVLNIYIVLPSFSSQNLNFLELQLCASPNVSIVDTNSYPHDLCILNDFVECRNIRNITQIYRQTDSI